MNNQLSEKIRSFYTSNKFPWIIIFIGIALRLIRYLHNPSLWFDEADTAVFLLNKPFSGLFKISLDDTLSYPFGFLALVKTAADVLGNSEYALRLIPLLFGILSLVLFYPFAKYFIKPKAVPIALSLFAILDPFIFHSTTLTPYSSDVAFTLVLFMGAIYIQTKNMSILKWFSSGVLGAIIVWVANPSLFVLSGIGVSLAIPYLRRKEWAKIGSLSIPFLISALSFLAYYFLYVRHLIANLGISMEQQLIMERALMPFPPTSLLDIKWYIDSFFGIFDNPLGFTLLGIAALAFFVGCTTMIRENKDKFILLMFPVFFTLFAALLHMYPFKGRLILFLAPVFLLFIAEGAEKIFEKLNCKSVIAGTVFMGLLFLHPLIWATYHANKPTSTEDVKPVLKYMEKNWQDGDLVYVYYYSQFAFEYYSKLYPNHLSAVGKNVVVGIAPRGWYRMWKKQDVYKYYSVNDKIRQSSFEVLQKYTEDLNKLQGQKRVWLLFTASIDKDGINEEKHFIYQLQNMGKQLDSFGKPGNASVYLYDLS